MNFDDNYIMNYFYSRFVNSYLSSRKDKIITNIESSNEDFKFLKCFKKSIGRESYYYLLTLHSNCIYIFDSTTKND